MSEEDPGANTKPFLDTLSGKGKGRPPVWLMRQAGRYLSEYREVRLQAGGFLKLCLTPDLAAEVTLQPIRRFGFDAAILFADILLIPHAMGQTLDYVENEGPVLEPVRDRRAVEALRPEAVAEILAPVYETVSRVAAELPPACALVGFAGAPWTVATYMVEGRGSKDHGTAKTWAARDPEGFAVLIDILVDATVDYLSAQVAAGAEALQLFDTWAGALSEPGFRRWCLAPAAEIVRRVRERHPGVPVIGFPRGAGVLYRDYLKDTKVSAVSIDSSVPVTWAAEHLQPLGAVQGNLDPHVLVAGGDGLRTETARILDGLKDGPHIFNLGHGIVPETPPEHVAELVSLIHG